jgi:glutamate mutase epsilon subunit
MFRFFKRLFPERIFRRKLEPAAERRVRLAQARAEESIIRTHVDNALMFVDTLAEDMTFDRAIDAYIREMSIAEPLASTVATRTLVILGQDLVPYRRRAVAGDAEGAPNEGQADDRPKLRLNDASQGRQRTVKRA